MSLPADYHMHTPLCRHAAGEPVEYARQAVEIGLTEIGFSDHSPMLQDNFDNWRMFDGSWTNMSPKSGNAQKDFPQLTIRLALEVDYLPGHEDWIRELAARHPWDYFIGSVHYVSDYWDIDNPAKLSEWKNRDAFEVWSAYFERLTMAAKSKLFEIIGHADLPKKFGNRPARDCTPLYEKFLAAAKNPAAPSSSTPPGCGRIAGKFIPAAKFCQLAFQNGVPITFGSDAHAPAEVGMNFAEAVQLARDVGYRECCQFANRKRRMTKLR